jgi:hypothetical protein
VKWESGGNSVTVFEDTVGAFARAHYGTLEVVNRLGTAFALFILPFFIVRHILVCSWCDRSFVLREIPAFDAILTQDASIIHGFCMVELFCGLYLLFRIIFRSTCHQQIMDKQIRILNRYRMKYGETRVSGMLKVIVVCCIVLIAGLVAMVASTPNSIRSFGLEKSEMMFFFLLLHIVSWYLRSACTLYILFKGN